MKEDDKQHCRIVLGCVDCLVATGGKDLVVSVGMIDENMVLGVWTCCIVDTEGNCPMVGRRQ